MPSMRAARLVGRRHFEIVPVPVPTPGPDEVLLRVTACGVCTSDTYVWNGDIGALPLEPGAPGHELCGVVVATGSNVSHIEAGTTATAIAFPGRGYAEYALAPAAHTVALPTPYQGRVVLGEPLACAMNALRRSGVMPGDAVLVIGAGFIGILLLTLLRHMGAAPIVVAEVSEPGRAWARRYGADAVVDPRDPVFAEGVEAWTHGTGFDVVIEAAGTASALDLVGPAARIRGTVVVAGYHVGAPRAIDMQTWNWKGLTIVNGHERDDAIRVLGMRKALALLSHGRIGFDVVTHTLGLDAIDAAFSLLRERPPGFLKAVIDPRAATNSTA
jgi:NADPH:quinone reductase